MAGGAERSVLGMARDADNVVARLSELESLVARLEARLAAADKKLAVQDRQMALKDGVLIDQLDRIAELERALEDAHRRSKRQSAPFSKGDPKPKPRRPGRKAGDDHGRHGHRPTPLGAPDRDLVAPLPESCPDCGGRVCHDGDEAQWQFDVPEPRVVTTRFTVAVGHCEHCAGGCRDAIPSRSPTRWARQDRRSARWPRRPRRGCTTDWG